MGGQSCGGRFAELLDRCHRVWSFDHLLSPAVSLVFLVLGGRPGIRTARFRAERSKDSS